nr:MULTISPECIES: 2Fe-2S iron-sulfur cluster-binding protein [Pseudomonadota]
MNGKLQVDLGLGNSGQRPRSSEDRIARRCDTATNLGCNALSNCQALPRDADGGLSGLHLNIGKLNIGNDLKPSDNCLCHGNINLTVGKSDPHIFAKSVQTDPTEPGLQSPARSEKRKRWTGDLRIAQIFAETPTVKTFRMVMPSGERLPFDFLPGQFLQVEVQSDDGTKAKRSYTIASSPTQRAYVELTVKREAQGTVSRHLHDIVKRGDLVRIAGPFGHFTFTGSDAESIVLIAGGVGITPMMSVLRFLTDTAWAGDIFFVYAARSTEEFLFRTEIEQLERRHANLRVFASMQRTPGTVWHGAEGPITRELLESAVPEIAKRRIHLCGPPPMMLAMRNILTEIGVPDAQIYSEAFGPASLPVDDPAEVAAEESMTANAVPPSASSKASGSKIAATTVTFSVAGISAALDATETILEAAETAGVEIPYSCRVGECGVCVTRLLQGEVAMDVETGLDQADKAQGYVLACQARCVRGPLVVEA